ncbi:MAG TPA: Asp-tRNA(Asn)/Glu-tRNA(Gln) amidotransferase subunit GatC [Candidatus Margulisiibacteriota bacterium]|nr:Asp-tRNA(Asn)/Glu-tRNA(Gln) amidotransferase subunit GatC [Candidatus Margulisiibacteriota bacterium]
MPIDKGTVEYVAHLSRIELKDEELQKLSRQLQDILDFIDKLEKAQIQDVPPTSHILPIGNVLREDKVKKSLGSVESLANAPLSEGNFYAVPKIIE